VAAEGLARDIPRDIPSPATAPSASRSRTSWPPWPPPGRGPGWETIRRGLASFVNDSDNAPGRFNVMDYKGATVIADYGHNPDAMRALVQAVEAMPAKRRRWSSAAPATAATRTSASRPILGKAFDDVVLYQDACQRGRADGEVLALLRQGLAGAAHHARGRDPGEFLAIDPRWPPAARRPVPGAGRPGGRSAGPSGQARGRRLNALPGRPHAALARSPGRDQAGKIGNS
jgi:hypothetical protein